MDQARKKNERRKLQKKLKLFLTQDDNNEEVLSSNTESEAEHNSYDEYFELSDSDVELELFEEMSVDGSVDTTVYSDDESVNLQQDLANWATKYQLSRDSINDLLSI